MEVEVKVRQGRIKGKLRYSQNESFIIHSEKREEEESNIIMALIKKYF